MGASMPVCFSNDLIPVDVGRVNIHFLRKQCVGQKRQQGLIFYISQNHFIPCWFLLKKHITVRNPL